MTRGGIDEYRVRVIALAATGQVYLRKCLVEQDRTEEV